MYVYKVYKVLLEITSFFSHELFRCSYNHIFGGFIYKKLFLESVRANIFQC